MDEKIKKIIEQLDARINLHNIIKEPISSDLDKAIKLSVAYEELLNENLKLQQELQQKEDIIYKIKKCIEEKEEYYGDYMGDGNYTMYSMMGANNNRIPYIKSNLIKQILDNKGDENDG